MGWTDGARRSGGASDGEHQPPRRRIAQATRGWDGRWAGRTAARNKGGANKTAYSAGGVADGRCRCDGRRPLSGCSVWNGSKRVESSNKNKKNRPFGRSVLTDRVVIETINLLAGAVLQSEIHIGCGHSLDFREQPFDFLGVAHFRDGRFAFFASCFSGNSRHRFCHSQNFHFCQHVFLLVSRPFRGGGFRFRSICRGGSSSWPRLPLVLRSQS